MVYPVKDVYVTYPYGVKNSNYAAGVHTGTDFRAAVGTNLYATWKGTVVFAGGPYTSGSRGPAYGNHVVIKQTSRWGRTRYVLYCHMTHVGVRNGQKVDIGERIGTSGQTGNATGPHLHYEERTSPFGYYNHAAPIFLDDKKIIRPAVRLSKLKPGKKNKDVGAVRRALRRRGIDSDKSLHFNDEFQKAYAKWQRRLGFDGKQANGIPGEFSLEKLGFRVKK